MLIDAECGYRVRLSGGDAGGDAGHEVKGTDWGAGCFVTGSMARR